MTETNTLINWPARLKIGARSKKGRRCVKIGQVQERAFSNCVDSYAFWRDDEAN